MPAPVMEWVPCEDVLDASLFGSSYAQHIGCSTYRMLNMSDAQHILTARGCAKGSSGLEILVHLIPSYIHPRSFHFAISSQQSSIPILITV